MEYRHPIKMDDLTTKTENDCFREGLNLLNSFSESKSEIRKKRHNRNT